MNREREAGTDRKGGKQTDGQEKKQREGGMKKGTNRK